MRRLLASVLIALLPAVAIAQWAPTGAAPPARVEHARLLTFASTAGSSAVVVPLWQSADGHLLALVADDNAAPAQQWQSPARASNAFNLQFVDASAFMSTGVRWAVSPHFYTRAGVNQTRSIGQAFSPCAQTTALPGLPSHPSCANDGIPQWLGGEVGGGFNARGVNLDVGVSWLDRNVSGPLPVVFSRVGVAPSVLGIPGNFIDSLGGVNARGSMRWGQTDTSLSLGASIGRLELAPGRVVGIDAVDQKALSFGVGNGPISGVIVGRLMQPVAGSGSAMGRLDQHWSAIDLGITWHLPWQGELSVGAQNLWSSGAPPVTTQQGAMDAAQHRVPYIQYHQEL